MADIIRWDPFREVTSLRDAMDRLFEDSFVRPSRFWPEIGSGDLAIDMYQTADDVVVKASIPGMKPEEVDISIAGDILTIPVAVKTDKAKAVFENGVLTLTLPKAEEVKPKQIKIKAKALIESGKK